MKQVRPCSALTSWHPCQSHAASLAGHREEGDLIINHPFHILEGHGSSYRTNKGFIPERLPNIRLYPSLQMAVSDSVVSSRPVSGFPAWLQIPESWLKLLSGHHLLGPGKQDGVCSGEPPPPRPMEGGCWGSWRSQGWGPDCLASVVMVSAMWPSASHSSSQASVSSSVQPAKRGQPPG